MIFFGIVFASFCHLIMDYHFQKGEAAEQRITDWEYQK